MHRATVERVRVNNAAGRRHRATPPRNTLRVNCATSGGEQN